MNTHPEPSELPPSDAIRAQLERILGSPAFARSPVLARFLAHITEHALREEAPRLKEYTIGIEVLHRPPDFDPRADTSVRVHARRLRAALDDYYAGPGSNDPLRFAMPRGQYELRIEPQSTSPLLERPARDPVDGDAARVRQPSPAPLPVPRTPILGRDTERELLLQRLLDPGVRLLTITGVGGTGKTRLSLDVAARLEVRLAGGVRFVDLSAARSEGDVAGAIADAFELRRTSGRALWDAIREHLRDALVEPTLLLLDNFEVVLDSAPRIGQLLDASPALRCLVTSRLALRIYGEQEFPLAPLAVPDADSAMAHDAVLASPALQLFCARAQARVPQYRIEADQVASAAELCRRLDGLPLAIELVAAQAAVLTPERMLQRFTGHLDLPPNPVRDAPARQRTLRRTIDWSFELLGPEARALLARLSVFPGGFTLEGAEAVADAWGDVGSRLQPTLQSLLDTGLVHLRDADAESRYHMLELVRTYGIERLNASGDGEAIRLAHAAYCLVLAEEGLAEDDSERRERWLSRCDRELPSLRAALDFLPTAGRHEWALRLGQALFAYWDRRESFIEGRQRLEALLERVPFDVAPARWAKLSAYLATLLAFLGEHDVRRFTRLVEIHRKLGDRRGEASSLTAVGTCLRLDGDAAAALQCFREALDLCREIGEPLETAGALSNVAKCELAGGRIAEAHALLVEAQSLFEQAGDSLGLAWCLNQRGDVERVAGRLSEADVFYRDAESRFVERRDVGGVARSRADRGRLALDRNAPVEAAGLLAAALRTFHALEHRRAMAGVAELGMQAALACNEPALALRLGSAADAWRRRSGFVPRMPERSGGEAAMRAAREAVGASRAAALADLGAREKPETLADALDALAAAGASPVMPITSSRR